MAIDHRRAFWIIDGNNGFATEVAVSLVVKSLIPKSESGAFAAGRAGLRTRDAYFFVKRIIELLNDKITLADFADANFSHSS